MARVTLEGVRKIYDGPKPHVAVHGVDLAIGDGEFVVLVGPSGCGKSTTLRMIAGLESISAGRLSIGDRVVNDVPAKDRDIAMVFQNYALYPHMSVYENMAFALRMRHVARPEIDTRVRDAAEVLGLTAVLERRPAQLSGGQRQRVALGRAIVRQPKVFLFDEPLSNLDAKLRVQMRREISRLHQRLGVTMVYVTHDQVEAMTLGERIVVLNAGHVQQIATPLELYDQPRNRFVAGFIGSPAMNFVDGELVRSDGLHFAGAGGAVRVALDPAAHPALAERGAGPLTLGVRPEDVAVRDAGDASADARIRVDLVEPMGHETYVYGRAGEQEITARIAPEHQPRVGAEIGCAFDRRKLHFFDPTSGERVR
jgi:multiple sugar transport system ATP-binding protein